MKNPTQNIIAVPKGEQIFAQGQKIDYVYLLLHGTVSLWNKNHKILLLNQHQILGLEGLYNQEHEKAYTYGLIAETNSRLRMFAATDIPAALLNNPKLGESVLQSLGAQLSECWRLLADKQTENKQAYFAGQIIICSPGEYVIRENEKTSEMYKIISTDLGLEVSKSGQSLAVLKKAGDFFGEMAAVLKEPRTASVRSLGNSVLEVYPSDVILNVLIDYPDLSYRIISGLSTRLARANEKLTSLGA